jgi:hypothetical protein
MPENIPPRGRPKKDGSEKKIRLTIYLTDDEKVQIEQHAKELGMSPTSYVKFSTFSQMKKGLNA